MIQDHEIDAWLGNSDLSPDQRARFSDIVRAYDGQIASKRDGERADWAEDDTAAAIAALELVQGDLDLQARGRAYREAQTAAYMGAVIAHVSGDMHEHIAAEQVGISRGTLRRALGK
jgi:hypothetical protein